MWCATRGANDSLSKARSQTSYNQPTMPSLFVLYPTPADVELFDRRYRDEHALLVKAHLGMAKFIQHPVLGSPVGKPPFHLVIELVFDSADEMQKALASSGGDLTAKHAFEISNGGPPVMLITK